MAMDTEFPGVVRPSDPSRPRLRERLRRTSLTQIPPRSSPRLRRWRPVGNYKLQSEFQYQSLRYASHPPFPVSSRPSRDRALIFFPKFQLAAGATWTC